ncbi:hypothetical protein RvY_03382-2 [Ramazzottius varieornatus]|uniref:Uncharacterized protein n=1 Tax=Ramazzottius varieornatus TaxID=947166 RepID=A0A1D1UMX3_RAMVA|nr:hypothetical protein RvY_03382-2 [Ramazzottius varieornatus]
MQVPHVICRPVQRHCSSKYRPQDLLPGAELDNQRKLGLRSAWQFFRTSSEVCLEFQETPMWATTCLEIGAHKCGLPTAFQRPTTMRKYKCSMAMGEKASSRLTSILQQPCLPTAMLNSPFPHRHQTGSHLLPGYRLSWPADTRTCSSLLLLLLDNGTLCQRPTLFLVVLLGWNTS